MHVIEGTWEEIKRHEAEFNAFAGFLEARGRALPTEADCLDFIAERSGCRLAGLREPTSSRRAQLARRPLILLMETLAGGVPEVGQATTPLVERCPARFRVVRDEYLEACRRRGNAEASVVTKQRTADQFLAYLEEVGREIFDLTLAVARGGITKSEALGHQEFVLTYKSFEPIGPSCLPSA